MKKEQSISVRELYIGIGSNLHEPKEQVSAAIQKLLETGPQSLPNTFLGHIH